MVGSPVGIEFLDDALEIPERGARGVGIAAIGDHLDLCNAAAEQAPLEILVDADDEERAAAVDPGGYVSRPAERGFASEDSGSIQARQKSCRAGAAVLVNDR